MHHSRVKAVPPQREWQCLYDCSQVAADPDPEAVAGVSAVAVVLEADTAVVDVVAGDVAVGGDTALAERRWVQVLFAALMVRLKVVKDLNPDRVKSETAAAVAARGVSKR